MIIKRELRLKTINIGAWNAKESYYEINQNITILKADNCVIGGILNQINEDNIVIKKGNAYIKIYFEDIERIEDSEWLCGSDIREQ